MKDDAQALIIVGAGLAGAKAAEGLRERGFTGRVVLVGNERHLPYERPPLSKAYLMGSADRDSMIVHPREWYAEQNVELRLGEQVTAVDRSAHLVQFAGGEQLHYDRLLLATGSAPRRLTVPGADSPGVHHLRTVDDSAALRSLLVEGSRLVVIGAGWIGLEIAAAARQAGVSVSVVESASLPLLGVLGAEAATVFLRLHQERGVDFRLDATVREIRTDGGAACGVLLGDGEVLTGDTVLVAVGAAPNTAVAEQAGLDVENGVLTDARLRTSDPDVFAAGDLANVLHPFYGYRVRVEHWANALRQPETAAAAMLGDASAGYDRLPYFFTDQYDLGMEYVGHVPPAPGSTGPSYDQVVFRGDRAAREFIAFWLREGRVLAGMAVNVWDMVDPITALIRSRAQVDVARLADPGIALPDVPNTP